MANPTRAIGYIRVSTEDQALGPEAQLAAITRYCQDRGAELVNLFTDQGASGKLPPERRPGLTAALAAISTDGATLLVVARRDRLAREPTIAALVENVARRSGAKIVSTANDSPEDTDPAAEMTRGIVDVLAKYERSLIAARVKGALDVLRTRGERVSRHAPFGFAFALDGDRTKLVESPEEASVLALVRDLHTSGMSLRKIAETLNDRGIPARGERWHKTSIVRILGLNQCGGPSGSTST
jgi:DNA invertase Pin-like site-specific DNA recombinase